MKPICAKIIIFTLLLGALFSSEMAFGEYVFLKNGRIHEGKILSHTASVTVVRTLDRKRRSFPNNQIMRILYTKFYMGCQYVRLTDGRVLSVYKVDEDNESITFREDINSPKEIKIRRTKILFLARKNPNELQGKADYTSVDISWRPPMGYVKKYRIYLKEKGKTYTKIPAAEKSGLKATLRNLRSSRDYCIVVTAVDENNSESLPSNEICVATKNLAPTEPGKPEYIFSEDYKKDGKKLIRAKIQWEIATDRDGAVAGYQVFLKKPDSKEYTLLKELEESPGKNETGHRSFTISPLKDGLEYRVKIRAIDRRKKVSSFSAALRFSTENKLPDTPERLKKRLTSMEGNSARYQLSWSPALDRDGRVVSYHVYKKVLGGYRRIGETKAHRYEVKGVDPREEPRFAVSAVDNRGGISALTGTTLIKGINIYTEGVFLLPLGDMGKFFGPGGGGLLHIGYNSWPLKGMNLGIRTGYFYFTPEHEAYKSYEMIPVMASLEYSYQYYRWFFSLSGAFGGGYNRVSYQGPVMRNGMIYFYDLPEKMETAFQPVMMAGISIKYALTPSFYLGGGVSYGGVIEDSGVMHFLSLQLGAGMKIF